MGEQAAATAELSETARAAITGAQVTIPEAGAELASPEATEAPEIAAVGDATAECLDVPGVAEAEEDAQTVEDAASDAHAEVADTYAQRVELPEVERPAERPDDKGTVDASEARGRLAGVSSESGVEIERPKRPPALLTGEQDPALIGTYEAELVSEIDADGEAARLDALADRGECDVASTETLEPQILDLSELEGEDAEDPVATWEEAVAEAGLEGEQVAFTEDVDVPDLLGESNAEARATWEDSKTQHTEKAEALQAEAQEQVDTAMADAALEEAEAHADLECQVDEARAAWDEENRRALDAARADAGQASGDATCRMEEGQVCYEREADAAIDKAVADAEAERTTAEARAEAERERAGQEGEEGGFWSWVGDVLDVVIEAIQTVLEAIFDALRWVVDMIFTALGAVLDGLLAVYQWAATAILRALRWTLEQLRDGLVALLGETAGRWIDAINGFITDAIDVIDAIYGWVRDAVSGIIEMINQGLQDILTLIQWSLFATILLYSGLWLRYLWIAVENLDRIVANVLASLDGLGEVLMERLGPDWEEFWTSFWTPANQTILGVGLIVWIASHFVAVGEVIDIIFIILAALYPGLGRGPPRPLDVRLHGADPRGRRGWRAGDTRRRDLVPAVQLPDGLPGDLRHPGRLEAGREGRARRGGGEWQGRRRARRRGGQHRRPRQGQERRGKEPRRGGAGRCPCRRTLDRRAHLRRRAMAPRGELVVPVAERQAHE